jgi:hypothetical protein
MTDEARGFLVDLVTTVGSVDRAFVSWRKDGVRLSTAQALDWFWAQPQAAALRVVADRPQLDWDELVEVLLGLAMAEPRGQEVGWGHLSVEALRLTSRDVVAAAAVSLYALAGWMGSCGERLLRFPPDLGWFVVPARTASALLSADAVHGAELVTKRAREFVEEAEREVYERDFQVRLVPLREVAARIAQRHDDDVAGLAWNLRAACRPGAPNLRAQVAALFWTVGDVPRAYLLAHDDGYLPTLDLMKDLVTITMARVGDDPLLQYVWLAMKDRAPLELRRHHRLFARLNLRYTHTPLQQMDQLLPEPVGRVYAEALIAHFGAGPSGEQLDGLATAWMMVPEMLGDREPLARLRLGCLVNLLLSDDDDRPARWREMTGMATGILRAAAKRGDFTAFHRCLALPTFYLQHAPGAPNRDALAAVEEHRAAGLHYWLTASPQPPPPEAGLADLLRTEIRLLDQLRAARFVRLTRHLPRAYHRFMADLRAAARRAQADAHPLDQERAAQLVTETWQQLDALWERMREVRPDYAGRRANPVQLDEFANALTATTPSTLPIGPTPVRRRDTEPATGPGARPVPAPAPVLDGEPDEGAVRRMRAEELGETADELVEQYHRTQNAGLLDQAIRAHAEACHLLDEGSPEHLLRLDRLAMTRAGRYLHSRDEADIDAAIADHETAADLAEAGHIPVQQRIMLRFNAAMTRYHRYRHNSAVDDLRRALEHWRTAAREPDIPQEQALTLYHGYAGALREMYRHTGDPALLAETVTAQRAAVDLTPARDPNRAGRLADLALDLLTENQVSAKPGAVTEAVELLQQAVQFARQRDPRNLPSVLNNLALALLTRHAESHADADVDKAIAAIDEAASTAPIGPARAKLLDSLADLLEQRHTQRGDPADAERGILARSHAIDMRGQ